MTLQPALLPSLVSLLLYKCRAVMTSQRCLPSPPSCPIASIDPHMYLIYLYWQLRVIVVAPTVALTA